MSVLLINPPPIEDVAARIVTPPLGLAYLASSLISQGIATRVIDADALGLTVRQVAVAAEQMSPSIIGVTAMSPTSEAAYRVLSELRPLTDCLVLGGPHPSALGGGIFEDCPVKLEAAFRGECEEIFPVFAKHVLDGGAPGELDLPGLTVPGTTKSDIETPVVHDLDALPFPARDQLPARAYRHPLFGKRPVASIISSRGCPYRCIFCDKHVSGSQWRPRSPKNVLAEIETIVTSVGVDRLIFYDDLFTLSRKRVIEICRGIIDAGINVRWKCEGRVNRVDAETLSWMRRAGCEMIAYGVETATEPGLSFLRKDITVEQVKEAFALTRAAGMRTLGYFMLGVPGETIEDELETVRLAIDIGADYAQFGVLSPFPGTALYDYGMERGWVKEVEAWGPAERGDRRTVLLDGYWTPERLKEITRIAHRSFYFRPSYVWRRLLGIDSFGELLSTAGQGLRLGQWWLKRK